MATYNQDELLKLLSDPTEVRNLDEQFSLLAGLENQQGLLKMIFVNTFRLTPVFSRPRAIFQRKSLNLDLTNLKITEATPEGLAQIFDLIRQWNLASTIINLTLSGNSLTELPEGLFQGLTALRKLALCRNQLSTLPEGLFHGLTALRILSLSHNQLNTLPKGLFHDLALRNLDLYHNQLSTLPEELFQGLTELSRLCLEDNQLSALPEGLFQGLTELQILSLGKNQLSTLPEGLFRDLAALHQLYLGKNQLSTLPEGLFQELTVLSWLHLNHNQLSTLPAGLFQDLDLDLRYSKLDNNFQLTLEGQCQVLVNQTSPNALAIFDQLMRIYSRNILFLKYALNNEAPWGVNFSEDQKKDLSEQLDIVQQSELVIFQFAKEKVDGKNPLFERQVLGNIQSLFGFR
jgi:Leucine-rich repeat (LRR) protein